MTTPDFSFIIPKKYKPWVAAIGSLLTFVVPTITEVAAGLPQPWPSVIAAVIAALTWLGVYKVPYLPKGTVAVPEAAVPVDTTVNVNTGEPSLPDETGQYQNPWR